MSIAAQARARAEAAASEKAEQEASAASAAHTKRQAAKIQPSLPPALSVPVIQPGRVTPAAQRRRFLAASTATSVLDGFTPSPNEADYNNDAPLPREAQAVVLQLYEDRRRLKEFKATDRKVEAKVAMLPAYRGWCDGVLSAGKGERGPLDQIFTTIMAWTIDVGDYLAALPMLEHAVKYRLEMPSGFNRDAITFAIDQICEDAIRVYDLGEDPAKSFPAAVLPMLQDLVEHYDIDLHDEVEAKLHKSLGLAIMAGADLEDEADLRKRREQTLKAYMRAIELFPRVGVKKDIERLQRELRKGQTEAGTGEQSSGQPDQTDATETNTPPSDG